MADLRFTLIVQIKSHCVIILGVIFTLNDTNAAFELSSGFGIFAVLILEKPHNTLALEGETVALSCTTSDSKAPVTWRRNNSVLQAGLKYDLIDKGAFHQLCIHNLLPEDSGTYTCDTGDAQCDVSLTVEGNKGRIKKPLCSNLFYHIKVELLYIDIHIFLNFNLISTPSVPEIFCTINALS